ncbi:MAG: hypothetical protein O3B64_02595 [bacterium]|nr:hypothetical protein [bacterium]
MRRHLDALHLPKHADVVLGAMLDAEEVKATQIIQLTGLHRQLVYDALKWLEEKHVVKRIQRNGVAHFRILSFDQLLHDAEATYKATKELAQEVEKKRGARNKALQIYEGVEGVNKFTDLVLEVGKPLYVLGANIRFRTYYPEIFELWNKKRVENGIPFKFLVSNQIHPSSFKDVDKISYRFFEGKQYASVLWIFGTYVAYLFWSTRLSAEIVVLRHSELAKQQKQFFKTLWEANKDTKSIHEA